MSAEKRYYWLKLKEDFFSSKRIKKLRQMAGGDTYLIIYLKLQLKAMKLNGTIRFDHLESTIAEELALDLDESADNVKVTLAYLVSCGLAETNDEASYIFLPYAVENVGNEGASAQRKREERARNKLLPPAESVTLSGQCPTKSGKRHGEIEIEIEKEIEIERESERDLSPAGESAPVKKAKKEKPRADDALFDAFWAAYPRKASKVKARESYDRIHPDEEMARTILDALEQQKNTDQWKHDNGRFIPYPATWLNQRRWEDEIPQETRREPESLKDRGLEDWDDA